MPKLQNRWHYICTHYTFVDISNNVLRVSWIFTYFCGCAMYILHIIRVRVNSENVSIYDSIPCIASHLGRVTRKSLQLSRCIKYQWNGWYHSYLYFIIIKSFFAFYLRKEMKMINVCTIMNCLGPDLSWLSWNSNPSSPLSPVLLSMFSDVPLARMFLYLHTRLGDGGLKNSWNIWGRPNLGKSFRLQWCEEQSLRENVLFMNNISMEGGWQYRKNGISMLILSCQVLGLYQRRLWYQPLCCT